MTGLNWLKNQRRERTKSARNPAVIARSRAPNGSRALVDTDGKTTRTRSRKIATRPNTETTTSGACRWGGRPVRSLSRYANGISQPTTSTNHTIVSHGWVKKSVRKQHVSTAAVPDANNRYRDEKQHCEAVPPVALAGVVGRHRVAHQRPHERERRAEQRRCTGEGPQPEEGHVQPRLLHGDGRRHPRVERRLAGHEHEEQYEGGW